MEETGAEEKARIAKQNEKLGPEGLNKWGERLKKAKEDNEVCEIFL